MKVAFMFVSCIQGTLQSPYRATQISSFHLSLYFISSEERKPQWMFKSRVCQDADVEIYAYPFEFTIFFILEPQQNNAS